MINSLIVSGVVVSGPWPCRASAASRSADSFPWAKHWLPILLTIGLVLPFEVLMVPIFYTFRDLGPLDSTSR